MSLFIAYLVKLSISLAIVWLFYQFVLRKLTFYNSNRWYLLGYTLFCFFIPLIDISPVLQQNEWANSTPVSWVPVIENYKVIEMNAAPSYNFFTTWNIVMLVVATGMLIMLFRLVMQLVSFRRMMRKAKPIPGENVNLFQVDEEIIPFSFGNSIFLNKHLHTTGELQEIIRHEFVHVKQKHSIDIIWGELLCLFNWYNPFAWLLKRSIRQNLEFVADNKVLENGIDKKQYQYLLLKVIGNNQFSIAPKFNFSSLKKRIAMMNKLKTTRLHLVRFLFILPLLAVILLSFRKQIGDSFKSGSQNERAVYDTIPGKEWNPVPTESEKDFIRRHSLIKNITWGYILSVSKNDAKIPGKAGDALMTIHFKNGKWDMYNLGRSSDVEKFKKNYGEEPPLPPPYTWMQEKNSKGNYIDIVDNNGNSTVVVKNSDGKEIDRLLLNKWNENQEYYDNLYGAILPPPPAVPPNPPIAPIPPDEDHPLKQAFLERNPDVKNIGWLYNNVRENLVIEAHIFKKDGTMEKYDLNNAADKARVQKKYGELPFPVSDPPTPPAVVELPDFVQRIDRSAEFVEIWMKDGKKESYNLKAPSEKAAFEKKYGELIPVLAEPPYPLTGLSELNATQELNRANIGEDFEINDNKASVRLKNGKVEEYNLANDAEKKKFETKYGKIIEVEARVEGLNEPVKVVGFPSNKNGSNEPITVVGFPSNRSVNNELVKVAGFPSKKNLSDEAPLTGISTEGTRTVLAPTRVAGTGGVTFLNDEGNIISGEEEILITITRKSTQQQLEEFVKQMQDRGIQLKFDNTKYDNGILVHIDGTMKIKGSNTSFSATDFNKLILSRVKNGDHIYLKVDVVEKTTS